MKPKDLQPCNDLQRIEPIIAQARKRTLGEHLDTDSKALTRWYGDCSTSKCIAKKQPPGECRVVPAPKPSNLPDDVYVVQPLNRPPRYVTSGSHPDPVPDLGTRVPVMGTRRRSINSMSKKNITHTEKLGPSRVRVTFKADDGERVYEYVGSSARAFEKGTDPSELSGRLVEHRKPKK